MLLREAAAAGTEVWALAGVLKDRRGAGEGRTGGRSASGGSDSRRAARRGLNSAGSREGMSRRRWAVPRGRRRKRRVRPDLEHDEIAA